MSAPRLTFLYPLLFAPAKQPATVVRGATAATTSRTARRPFSVAERRRRPAARQRYGTANEPPPHLGGPTAAVPAREQNASSPSNAKDLSQSGALETQKEKMEEGEEEEAEEAGLSQSRGTDAQNEKESAMLQSSSSSSNSETTAAKDEKENGEKKDVRAPDTAQSTDDDRAIEALPPTGRIQSSHILEAAELTPLAGPSPQPQIHAKPLETILNMASSDYPGSTPAPVYENSESSGQQSSADQEQGNSAKGQAKDQPLEQKRPPHISTPPYVHHFDTYGLVRRLEEGGWTQDQAITLMKAVRLILSENMKLAHHGLVSKSNVENDSYLFNAACSELKTEIQTKRKTEGERSRTDRTQLQHEVDILSQRMTQDTANLKDELKGMFDDRKMFVRNDQREMERKIQELNYRITVVLNSDSRSEVEGVRWIITKRAISALAICVAMILGSLKFASSVAQWEEEEKKQLAAAKQSYSSSSSGSNGINFDRENSPKAQSRGDHMGGGNGGGGNGGGNGGMGQDKLGGILVQEGDNPAFVSLG